MPGIPFRVEVGNFLPLYWIVGSFGERVSRAALNLGS
jgi:hypothetical protein